MLLHPEILLLVGAAAHCAGGVAPTGRRLCQVTYTNDAKHEMLGVPRHILDGAGPVSAPAAEAMAAGALGASRADIAVSITGFTEGAPGQPAGLVHFACARRGADCALQLEQFGDIGRAAVRLASLRTALRLLNAALERTADDG